MDYEYDWIVGSLAPAEVAEQLAELYSNHYGVWSQGTRNAGEHIRLSSKRIREWLRPDTAIARVHHDGNLVGYAIVARSKIDKGIISWVTQFVVHAEHRKRAVGKTLLFSSWNFTNHFAWGLVTANPYAIRALEKATRRRCVPERIARNRIKLLNLGTKVVPYLSADTKAEIDSETSKINTNFPLDHSQLENMLANVTTTEKPWLLGDLPESWEWFAFTFNDQEQFGLTTQEIETMLSASDQVTKQAYSRMTMGRGHAWLHHTEREVQQIIEYCRLQQGQTILDVGCGPGRHVLHLARLGLIASGVDYIPKFVIAGRQEAERLGLRNATFLLADCRELDLATQYDAVICLYDVIGSYAEDNENKKLLNSIAKHVKSGGFALISVMNLELTQRKAKHFFSLRHEPDKLLALPASSTMEKTGNIFDPDYYMIDTDTSVVYRKEQFSEGNSLPSELIVRDRRYTLNEIDALCTASGLDVIWSRPVRSGAWETALQPVEDKAKEILILCRKPV